MGEIMAKQLGTIQTAVQHYARDEALSLTTVTNLIIFNRIYRELAAIVPWPEFRRQDTTLTTTAESQTVAWMSSPVFLDVTSVEIQDGEDGDNYKIILPPNDEWVWSESGSKPYQSVPDHYVRQYVSSQNEICLRPAPKYSGKNLRITGSIEPTALTVSGDSTAFLQKSADDALEFMLAADIASRDGFPEWGAELMQKAARILKKIFGKELVPDELLGNIIKR